MAKERPKIGCLGFMVGVSRMVKSLIKIKNNGEEQFGGGEVGSGGR